jgi:hypothetical protein
MRLEIDGKILSFEIRCVNTIKNGKESIDFLVVLDNKSDSQWVIITQCKDLFHAISARNAIINDLKLNNFWTFESNNEFTGINEIIVNEVKND